MNPELVHPHGNITAVLPLLDPAQQRRYQDALKRRPAATFHSGSTLAPAATRLAHTTRGSRHPHPDGYVCLTVTDADETPVGLVIPTPTRDAFRVHSEALQRSQSLIQGVTIT